MPAKCSSLHVMYWSACTQRRWLHPPDFRCHLRGSYSVLAANGKLRCSKLLIFFTAILWFCFHFLYYTCISGGLSLARIIYPIISASVFNQYLLLHHAKNHTYWIMQWVILESPMKFLVSLQPDISFPLLRAKIYPLTQHEASSLT